MTDVNEKDLEKAQEAAEDNKKVTEETDQQEADTKESAEASEGQEKESEKETKDTKDAEEGKGKFFKKKKTDKKDEKIAELNDKYTRLFAEFDNFRKRTEKEKAAMFEVGAKSVIEKILPVVDNFERGLGSLSDEEKETPFAQGMDKVYKQLMNELDAIGVKPIEAVGKEFDPAFHNAVMHVEDEELGENVVAEEFQKGYMYRESVVRHSMVKVAN